MNVKKLLDSRKDSVRKCAAIVKTPRQNPRAIALSRTGLLDPRSALGSTVLSVLGLVLVVVLVLIRTHGGP